MTDIVTRLAQWAENDMKAEGIALDAKHTIEELRKDVTAFWNEMELMRSDLSIYAAEIERLREALQNILKVPNSEAAQGIMKVFATDALQQNGSE